MSLRGHALSIMAAMMLGGCASLTAEAPLFGAADALDPAPIVEGVWVRVSENCAEATIQSPAPLPAHCMAFELRRTRPGWTIQIPASHAEPSTGETPVVVAGVIASAVERDLDGLAAPLYVLERVERDDEGGVAIRYDGIVPIGAAPAREALVFFEISCGEALADGPIAGVTREFDQTGRTMSCIAQNRAAVREAVRRAAIENLPYLHNSRFVLRQPMSEDAALVAAARPRMRTK